MIALLAMTAFGQDLPQLADVDSQLWRAPMDSRTTLWTESTGRMVDGVQGRGRFFGHYVHQPFVFVDDDGEVTDVVTGAAQLSLLGMLEFNRFRLGLDAPIYLYSAGLDPGGAGLGDIEVDGRATILDRTKDAFGLALSARLALPTTTVDLRGLGEDGLRAQFLLHHDMNLGERLYLGSNLGVRIHPKTELLNIGLNDQLLVRMGAGYALSDKAGLSADLNAQANLAELEIEGLPIEGMLGGWGRVSDKFVVRGGLGRGLTPGIGSPWLRALVSLAYEPPIGPRDLDADGIVDSKDACPDKAEDRDGYMDDDGCPEPTKVAFAVKDAEGNPVDGFTWEIASASAKGGADKGAELYGGAYDVVFSGEGFVSKTVSAQIKDQENQTVEATLEAVQPMGSLQIDVQDEEGKPLPDVTWSASSIEGGGKSGKATEVPAGEHAIVIDVPPGYRASKLRVGIAKDATVKKTVKLRKAKVELTKEKIDIKDSVYFETAKAVIKSESHGLLDEVAEIIIDHPELTKIRIEGHTDSRGNAAYNKRLSQSRADAVREYLQGKGVAADRLESIGYGEERPIDNRNNAEAWTKNRRVDFFVAERSD